ncbi:MAG: class I SAM-dependent methyltransferase [Lachnospiraceae bacterium]|nr:class I SAM-dependent methyltransferase [Lachnospiraceae bacterium]
MEVIGKVTLDDSKYIGKDLYSDGNIEDELLEIVKTRESSEYEAVIREKHEWAVLYHLSERRGNIVDWMEDDGEASVLEVGSGCGAVTGTLSKKYKSVTCIELSKKRSLINAYRNRDRDNVKILLGNYKDVERDLDETYDLITLIGVFEYAKGYMGSEDPYADFLNSLKKHLKPGGKIVIAIENKLGLKYWAGCAEDHCGRLYEGLEGYLNTDSVRTFTKAGLEKVINDCGCRAEGFYYPYPDYKLPTVIYSDAYLPKIGELNNNYNNFDVDRLLTFDESKVFDTVIEDGLFPIYSNSFLVVVREGVKR